MPYTFKDISIYFKSNCCNTISIVDTLGETMPKLPAHIPILKNVSYYEFTTTFNLAKLKFDPECHQLNDILYKYYHDTIKKYINKYIEKKQTTYMLYSMPEYQKSGLLHFHSICYFDNANDYYSAKLRLYSNNKFGNTRGKEVYDTDNFIKYISKDYNPSNILQPIYIHKNMELSPKEQK